MKSNYSILEKNTMDGFEHEDTKKLYLRGAARDELKAFKMAGEWETHLGPFLYFIKGLGLYQEKATEEVIEFIKERHFRCYFPNQ